MSREKIGTHCKDHRKRIFYTEEAIKLFIKEQPRIPRLFYYCCPKCGWYHLTSHNSHKFNSHKRGT